MVGRSGRLVTVSGRPPLPAVVRPRSPSSWWPPLPPAPGRPPSPRPPLDSPWPEPAEAEAVAREGSVPRSPAVPPSRSPAPGCPSPSRSLGLAEFPTGTGRGSRSPPTLTHPLRPATASTTQSRPGHGRRIQPSQRARGTGKRTDSSGQFNGEHLRRERQRNLPNSPPATVDTAHLVRRRPLSPPTRGPPPDPPSARQDTPHS